MITFKILPLISCCIFFFSVSNAQSDLTPVNLHTEYKTNPFIDSRSPRLSWELHSNAYNQIQTAYQIMVASSSELLNKGIADLWNSGKIFSNATNQVEYMGKTLRSKKRYFWKIRGWDKNNRAGLWSGTATWETGLLERLDWQAKWIGVDLNDLSVNKEYHLPPAPYLHKNITLKTGVKKARLYITALGLYEFYINGKRIGNDYFSPGWTDYNKRVYYQVYDVTHNLKVGNNNLGSLLSYGWYAGYIGYAVFVKSPQTHHFYGDVPLLKAQIEIEYNDGSREIVATDRTWRGNKGALLESDILQGETYDARLEKHEWAEAGSNIYHGKNVTVYPDTSHRLVELYPGNPVQILDTLKPLKDIKKIGDKYIFNFGQNFAGVVRLNVKGKAGDSIVLNYGEMLYPDGRLMKDNLRKARATDTYILKGDPNGETWTPRFTYHGFQYVEVSGSNINPSECMLTGLVMGSNNPQSGSFKTDNPMINQLYHNIVWSQRSNYFDIPTDCPQRDERLGWTGDAQIYIGSATFNNDISAFHTKWIKDLDDAQWPDGTFSIYAPVPLLGGKSAIRASDTYSPGWSEAGIICPYQIYRTYGDTRIIRESWPYMVKYMDFLKRKSKGQYYFAENSFTDISPRGGFGDWLSVGKKTPPDMLATMYYGYCANLMAEMAQQIGKGDEAAAYNYIYTQVKKAFSDHYIDAQGKFKTNAEAYGDGSGYVDGGKGFDGHTQTAYANAIYMKMLYPENENKAGDYLTALVKSNNNKLSTGFLGFKPLLPALSATGNADVAYQLLLSTTYPSLGFEVVNGSTTIWERWNSFTREKGFESTTGMNSFNHYAFGAVNEWLFGNLGGIKCVSPGFRTFIIKPEIPKEGIRFADVSYHSINGEITSQWKIIRQTLDQTVTVPVNTVADIYIPAKSVSAVTMNGKSLNENLTLKVKGYVNGYAIVTAGSGTYDFIVNNN